MINTRISIFKSLRSIIKELTRHGNLNPNGFRDILYAVILNDMKEWSEYVPNDDHEKIVKILNDYILEHKDFQIERFIENPDLYRNVNTPQDNTTWRRIWDNKNYKLGDLPEHDKLYGSPTFRLDGTTLIFYPKAKGNYIVSSSDPIKHTLNLLLHDQTLFENGRNNNL